MFRRSVGRASFRPFVVLSVLLLAWGLSARAQMGHTHQWAAVDNLPVPGVQADTTSPETGQLLAISPGEGLEDADECLNVGGGETPSCDFPNNAALDSIHVVSWSDGGAGGTFGYVDAYGQFVPSTNAATISHYISDSLSD